MLIVRSFEVTQGKRQGIYASIPKRIKEAHTIVTQHWQPVPYGKNKNFYRENQYTKSWIIYKHPKAKTLRHKKIVYSRLLTELRTKVDKEGMI